MPAVITPGNCVVAYPKVLEESLSSAAVVHLDALPLKRLDLYDLRATGTGPGLLPMHRRLAHQPARPAASINPARCVSHSRHRSP